jgi:diaminohydroxyphosphoribosylaminopyrimidine deaminase/5-amino-6-(5-phosphoribosylamino)uracil reductase
VIVDARLRTPPDARVFRERSTAPAILVTAGANQAKARRTYDSGRVEVIAVPDRAGMLALDELALEFGRRGWCKVLIEGGAHLAGSSLLAGIVDRVALFVAPKIVGDGLPAIAGIHLDRIRDSLKLEELTARPVGHSGDWLLEGEIANRGRLRKS